MTSVTGILKRHTLQRESWATGVLLVTSSDGGHEKGDLISVVGGTLGMVDPGEFIELEGKDEEHAWGFRFRISSHSSPGKQTVYQLARLPRGIESAKPVLVVDQGGRAGEGQSAKPMDAETQELIEFLNSDCETFAARSAE